MTEIQADKVNSESTRKIFLVTGSSRGLGAALAETLAGPETHVILLARTVGALEELQNRIAAQGGHSSIAVVDLNHPDQIDAFCASIHKRWGRLDAWLHAAIHTPPLAPAAHSDRADLVSAINVNILATAQLISRCTSLFKSSNSAMAVFFEDQSAGRAFFGAYGSTKAAQMALARSWKIETKNTGPEVHILQPVPMHTALRMRFYPGEDKSQLEKPISQARILTANLRKKQIAGSGVASKADSLRTSSAV